MMKNNLFLPTLLAIILFQSRVHSVNCFCFGDLPETESSIINEHSLPNWILDAKILIQYVGEPKMISHEEYSEFNRKEQRRRRITMTEDLSVDLDEMVIQYKKTGAKAIVSMVHGAYPGTEGLILTDNEVKAFRNNGFYVGVHYNLMLREMPVQVGDTTYIEVWQNELKKEVERTKFDFVFFDGALLPMENYRTPEFVRWYYNYASKNKLDVWVNDDWGKETNEFSSHASGDIIDMETETYDDVPSAPWINWDILTNEWNCWINEFGYHKRVPQKWEWKYRDVEDQLLSMLDVISKGGVWCIQMVNTKEAWKIMYKIGSWLDVNGEAIYGTRPLLPANSEAKKVPAPGTYFYYNGKTEDVWWYKWNKILDEARKSGPFFFTQKADKNLIYCIYYGDISNMPDFTLPEDVKIKKIQLLGSPSIDLEFNQTQTNVKIQMPEPYQKQVAYSFKIYKG